MHLIELYEYLQVLLTFYAFFKVFQKKYDLKIIVTFFAVSVLFFGLKLRIIPYELGSDYDRFLWGTYNVLYLIAILFIIHYNNGSNKGNIT